MKSIKLTKGLAAIVDDSSFIELSKYKWTADSKGYAFRMSPMVNGAKRKFIYMHRAILDAGDKQVDHIDGNPLNNSLSNLRIASHQENMRNRKIQKNNTTGYKGVWYNKRKDRFVATIKRDGMSRTLAHCKTAEEAADIYNQFAEQLFGRFARLNEVHKKQ